MEAAIGLSASARHRLMRIDCCPNWKDLFDPVCSIMSKDKPVVFDKKLVKQFHALVECPSTIGKRLVLLESMESVFEAPEFGTERRPN